MPDTALSSDSADEPDIAEAPDTTPDVSCDDGNACTEKDTTKDGACKGKYISCKDEDPCTKDTCDPTAGCVHVTLADCCEASIGAKCPEDLGFSCVHEYDKYFCLNVATDEVYVPAGPFFMGCNVKIEGKYCQWSDQSYEWETPQFRDTEPAFAIDRTEVTVGEYHACVEAGVCGLWPPGIVELPWIGITYYDSMGQYDESHANLPINYLWGDHPEEFCEWSGKPQGAQILCHEAQFEKAGRGGCDTTGCAVGDDVCCRVSMPTWPWGNSFPTCDKAVLCDDGCCPGFGFNSKPMPVGSRPAGASIYGALDLIGNVAETVDDFHCDYPVGPTVGFKCPPPVPGAQTPTARGGHDDWGLAYTEVNRLGYRDYGGGYGNNAGIRCCRLLDK